MDIPRFRSFCEKYFHLKERVRTLSDERSRPRIGIASLFQAVFYLGVLGLGSLLGLDQFLSTWR